MTSADSKTTDFPRHLYSLDALRGLAALVIVLCHWSHFFFYGTGAAKFDQAQAPFYWLLKPFYVDGFRAVSLFFCLSGFIFYWLYSEKIWRRETSPQEFFMLRFSRLYPLHFATLLFVAAGQQLMLWRFGRFFVYQHNDFFHFGLQLVFAQAWGFERGFSFNGPVWSVSVEILLYAIFFGLCLIKCHRWWQLMFFAICGYRLIPYCQMGSCMFSFFIGGISFQIFSYFLRRSPSSFALRFLGLFTMLMWVVVPLDIHHQSLYLMLRGHPWNESLNVHGHDLIGNIVYKSSVFSCELLLFPLTMVTLALWEVRLGALAKQLEFLGQISYSSYLLHFPLQMIFVGVTRLFGVPDIFFYRPSSLFLFFTILIPLCLISYRFFERPCQSWIRRRMFHSFNRLAQTPNPLRLPRS